MSKKYTLNQEDLQAILRGALMALGGALLTYLNSVILDTDFVVGGVSYTPIVVATWGIILNTARKFVTGY